MTKQADNFKYDPSTAAAAIFAALFLTSFVITLYQWISYRAWVWVVMVVAAGMESAGYVLRIISAQNPTERSPYVAQFSLIVLAPVLMAGGFYVIFGRIVYHLVPAKDRTFKLLWIPPRFITPIFVTSDCVCLLLQLAGAVKITTVNVTDPNAQEKVDKGKRLALIGVALQLVVFGFFCISATRFNFTSRPYAADFEKRINPPTDTKYVTIDGNPKKLKKDWKSLLRAVNAASLLIFIRTVYRTVDFALGRRGYTETHEWCLYIFDSVIMFPCVALFIYFHPAKYLPYLNFRLPKHARKGMANAIEIEEI